MPGQPDHSDRPNTLPSAELNPLLNPVLGQNMGRWAEVYFTSPPEKREQAVLELLRELRAENPGLEGTIVAAPPAASEPASPPFDLTASQPGVPCQACGRENPASHRFCGMCGKPLGEAATFTDPRITDLPAADGHVEGELHVAQPRTTGFQISDLHVADLHVADLHIEDQHVTDYKSADQHFDDRPLDEPAADPHNFEPEFSSPREAVYEPVLNTSKLSLFQSGGDSRYSDGQADELFLDPTAARPYRVYLGFALAAVILALGYMAWHVTQNESQSSRVEPQAPPAATTQAAASEAAAPSPSKTDPPNRASSTSQPAALASDLASNPSRARNERISEAGKSNAGVAAPPATPDETRNQTESLGGNGGEELAMAQRYLEGTGGQQRNPAEAAQWLWKAMAKHNAKAPVLLADLYLKGEGVSKNCDQARVLLDSATRAGVKDAAERLRHLQAFGCQ